MKYKKILVSLFSVLVFVASFNSVHAITPSLSLVSNGNDSVIVTVTGDSNSNVTLYYNSVNSNMQSRNLGNTNYNGYFTTTVSTSNYNAVAGSQAYVLVNGQQSASFVWPNTNNNSNGNISLSSTNVTVGTGQSQIVTIYNNNNNYPYNNNSYYISNNANTGIATANISGNTITIYGNNIGNTTFSVCSNSYNNTSYYANPCTSIYVNVTSVITNPTYNNGNLSLTQQNVTSVFVPLYQSVTLSSNMTNGSLYVATNSNSKIAQVMNGGTMSNLPYGCASSYGYNIYTGLRCDINTTIGINNNYISISGLKIGNSTMNICSTANNTCQLVRITVYNPNAVYVQKK